MKIKKGDKVVVISGKDKGKEGVIIEAFPEENRITVDGVNIRKVHVKPSNNNTEGGIIEVEKPIHASNVMISEGKKDKITVSRVGYKIENGKKVRILKKTGTRLN